MLFFTLNLCALQGIQRKEDEEEKQEKQNKKKNLWKYEILYTVYVIFMQVHCNKIKTFHIKTLTTYIQNIKERERKKNC